MKEQLKKEIIKLVEQSYQCAADHPKHAKEKALWPELIKIAGSIEQGNILDVGCGNGRIYKLFADHKDIHYVGVDSCTQLITAAQTNAVQATNEPEFIVGNILELNQIPQVNFDYLFCIDVLHHLPDKKMRLDAMKQIKNKVRPGGEIIITVWNFWKQPQYRKLIFKFLLLKLFKKNKMDLCDILIETKDPKDNTFNKCYYHAFYAHEIKKLMKQSGLKIKGFYKDKKTYYLMLIKP
jgi:2-polyprenyl-3-methyl-5-hydroxy-6-metoxy-1,4-benzoquinol methylase